MNKTWIPWCPSCGVEDGGLIGSGPDSVAAELIPRLSCKGCGLKVVALRVREMPQ